MLDVAEASALLQPEKPRREFLIPGSNLFPVRNVHALHGDGGTGKSLLLLQLAVATAYSTSWLNMMPTPGPVLYFSAEDDEPETRIRLHEIREGEARFLEEPHSLHIAFRAGRDAILAIENAKLGRMQGTALLASLKATVQLNRPRLVILDNLADIFAGNENSRPLSRQFIGMLRAIAMECDTTIIIAAHPSLSGISSGTGTSGNTAWNNSVRSRLYLKRQHDNSEDVTDPNFRRLVTMKANYIGTGGEIGMRWERGRFVPTDTAATATSAKGGLERMAAASKAERVFLSLVQRLNDEGRNISPATGANYAPLVFAKHPLSEGVTKRQFEAAMNKLLVAACIAVVQAGPPSRVVKNIVVKLPRNDD